MSPLISPGLPHSEADDSTVPPDTTAGRIKTKKKKKKKAQPGTGKMELSLNPITKKKRRRRVVKKVIG